MAPCVDRKLPHKKVLILGAGLSGIIAGKTLMDNGVDDFLILEGQDYIGGRIKKHHFAGHNIELGANWIHLSKEEGSAPIWSLKNHNKVEGFWNQASDFIIRSETGADITDMESYRHWKKVEAAIEMKQEDREINNKPEIPARVGLALLDWKPTTAARKAIEYFFTDFDYGKRPELISFQELHTAMDDYFVADQRGMISLYEKLYGSFEEKIMLNKVVKEVKYSSCAVEVTTSDGEVYSADYALCTFSTGVLASDLVTFDPPLPEWKQEAILKMPLSVYTKIFLKFPYKFWDDNEYILLAARKRGYFPVFQNLESQEMFPKGSAILLITVTEDEGRRIEKQSFAETKAEIVKMLRGVYGQDVPEPTDIFYPRWSTNPFTLGAFSEPVVGITSQDIKSLGLNLENLYFAGEALDYEWFGYMQGAYITGEEKGKILSKMIKCKGERTKTTEDNTQDIH